MRHDPSCAQNDPIAGPCDCRRSCRHPTLMPAFDEVAARQMTPLQVRQAFPRNYGKCPVCGWEGVLYASYAHYIAGDW